MSSLCRLSDEALCANASEGDRQSEECLVTRYSRLVRSCARPYFLAGGDSEDLIQEGMIGLLSAIRGFSPEKDVSFRTYAETCIRNRLRSAVRTAASGKYTPLNTSLSLDVPQFEESPAYPAAPGQRSPAENPEDVFISREERQARVSGLREQLSAFEKAVLELYLTGLSYAEIADRLRRAPKAVDNAVQRIRRKAAPYFSSGDISAS